MSDSRESADEILHLVLHNLDHLNLRDRVYDIESLKSKFGGSSDVHRGKLRFDDNLVLEVAIKRIRASVKEHPLFVKVSSKTPLQHISDVLAELCKGNEHLGETFA